MVGKRRRTWAQVKVSGPPTLFVPYLGLLGAIVKKMKVQKLHPKGQTASIAQTASISKGVVGKIKNIVGCCDKRGTLCLFLITAKGGAPQSLLTPKS